MSETYRGWTVERTGSWPGWKAVHPRFCCGAEDCATRGWTLDAENLEALKALVDEWETDCDFGDEADKPRRYKGWTITEVDSKYTALKGSEFIMADHFGEICDAIGGI